MSRAWMPLYVGDYLADTKHLTTIEHGAYLLLIMQYWQRGPLPDDDKTLRIITGLSAQQWRRARPKLAALFELEAKCDSKMLPAVSANAKQLLSKCWHHKRLDEELEKAEILRIKRQLAGFKGGNASRGRTNGQRFIAQAIAKQTGDQSQSHIESSTSLESEARRRSSNLAENVRARGWAT